MSVLKAKELLGNIEAMSTCREHEAALAVTMLIRFAILLLREGGFLA